MFEPLHAAELDWIVSLQELSFSPTLMRMLSNLGPSAYLMALVGGIYLCFDNKLGARLLFVYVAGQVVSHLSKLAFSFPRPFWIDDRVHAFESTATSFGLPSGHSLVAVCVWCLLAMEIRRLWFWGLTVVIVFLVSFSRIWLGAHFISDVAGGAIAGAFLLFLFVRGEEHWGQRFRSLTLTKQIVFVFIVTLAIVAAGFTIRGTLMNKVDLTQWPRYPGIGTSYRFLGAYAGMVFGLGIGLAMAVRWARFDAGGPVSQRVLRLLLVAVPALLYWLRPRGLLKPLADLPAFLILFTSCAVAAWIFMFALPWVFLKLKLADPIVASSADTA